MAQMTSFYVKPFQMWIRMLDFIKKTSMLKLFKIKFCQGASKILIRAISKEGGSVTIEQCIMILSGDF